MIPQAYYQKAAKLAEQFPGLDPVRLTYSDVFSINIRELPSGLPGLPDGPGVMVSFTFTQWDAAIWMGSQRYWAGSDDARADAVWESVVKPYVFEKALPVFRFFQSLPVDDRTIDLVELLEAG